MADLTIWAMTSGEAGMRTQALGLAEAIGGTIVEKTVVLRWPWRLLPGHLCPAPLRRLDPACDRPAPPWPNVLVTCGRRSTAVSIAVRRASGGHTLTVHVTDPQCPPEEFDLVVAMAHDRVAGGNVLKVETAIHGITADKMSTGAGIWGPRFEGISSPRIGILLGGMNRGRGFDRERSEALLADISRLHSSGIGILVTPSRRTEDEILARYLSHFDGKTSAYVWDRKGENPYLGILAWADAFVVTEDSVSMISEAVSTGKPVGTVTMGGHRSGQSRFIAALTKAGRVTRFDGTFPQARSNYAGNVSTATAAEAVKALITEQKRRNVRHDSRA